MLASVHSFRNVCRVSAVSQCCDGLSCEEFLRRNDPQSRALGIDLRHLECGLTADWRPMSSSAVVTRTLFPRQHPADYQKGRSTKPFVVLPSSWLSTW